MRSRSSVANTKALAESIAAGTAPPPVETPKVEPPAAGDGDIKPPRRRSEAKPSSPLPPKSEAEKNYRMQDDPELQGEVGDRAEGSPMDRAIDDVAAVGRAREPLPPSTPSQASELEMGNGLQRVVTHLFDFQGDPMETYERVRESLRLGTRASQASYGQLVDALDQAEEMAATAMELLINAKVTHDAFEIDSKIVKSALWDQATQALEQDKKSGVRTKQIVIADIESWIAVHHPDEWRALEVKIGQARRMVAMLEDLAERTRQRAGHLRVMARGATRE
jgi:hypothetical protein